nr:transposase [Acidithiobacillus caldus]
MACSDGSRARSPMEFWKVSTASFNPPRPRLGVTARTRDQNLKTAQAYQFRLTFQDIFTIKNRHQGATLLKAWLENARTSDLPPIVRVAYTIMNHLDGVLRWFESQITNGILEGFNSLIQSAKAKARGYRTHKRTSRRRRPTSSA